MEIVAVVVSVIAFMVSTYVGWRQNSLNERLVQVEEARLEREIEDRKRANVSASSRINGNYVEITLKNTGAAQANNISVNFSHKEFFINYGMFTNLLSSPNVLLPNDSVVYARIINNGNLPEWGDVEIIWENPSGQMDRSSNKIKLKHT